MRRSIIELKVQNYLDERRQLGYKLESPGRTLMSFAHYVDAHNYNEPLTINMMVDWSKCDKKQSGLPLTWARRLQSLKPFARYLQQFEPLTEVPEEAIFGSIQDRLTPHIFYEQEIIGLLSAAHNMNPKGGLRPVTYETLFGLLASTGLRVSEAVHLLDTDVNLKSGLLIVRNTKFNKSRQLPLHTSTIDALLRYRQRRNQYLLDTFELPFFISVRGKRLGHVLGLRQVHRIFKSLREQLGLNNRGAHKEIRIHDLSYPNLNKIQTFFKGT